MQKKRGRPSVDELMTPRPITAYERQRPPPELAGEEAEAFLSFANAESADWFTSATVPLLAQLARHIVQARRVAELIERNVGQKDTELAYYIELLKQQRAESQAIATLATKLRLLRSRVAPIAATLDRLKGTGRHGSSDDDPR